MEVYCELLIDKTAKLSCGAQPQWGLETYVNTIIQISLKAEKEGQVNKTSICSYQARMTFQAKHDNDNKLEVQQKVNSFNSLETK